MRDNNVLDTSLSICSTEYNGWFSANGQLAASQGLEDKFDLMFPAQTGSVEVRYVDPATGYVVEVDPGQIWLSNNNSTVSIPPPPAGATINIEYLQQY
jgi:hypothetical protein